MISAPHLYAVSLDPAYKPEGKFRCHWCNDLCGDAWRHGDPTFQQHSKHRTTAINPSSAWMCKGCWLFRRTRVTVPFHSDRFKDGQCPMSHSWLVMPEKAEALERLLPGEPYLYGAELLGTLLQPPKAFCLMLLNDHKTINEIHRAVANVHDEVRADTLLRFTVDNTIHEYTVYDLEQALEKDCHSGPGVRMLLNLFGLVEKDLPNLELEPATAEKRERGRPLKDNWEGTAGMTRRTITS